MPNEEKAPTQNTDKPKRVRLWLAARIVDYRLQALAPEDPAFPEGDAGWADIGSDTIVSANRESVYQLARKHDGLLLALAGLPSAGRLAALAKRLADEAPEGT